MQKSAFHIVVLAKKIMAKCSGFLLHWFFFLAQKTHKIFYARFTKIILKFLKPQFHYTRNPLPSAASCEVSGGVNPKYVSQFFLTVPHVKHIVDEVIVESQLRFGD